MEDVSNDWLHKLYATAMKSGKIGRGKLTVKREVKQDLADHHFRFSQSQFMLSCQNMGDEKMD